MSRGSLYRYVHIFNIYIFDKTQEASLAGKDFICYSLKLQKILYSCFSEVGIFWRIFFSTVSTTARICWGEKSQESDSLILYANFALTFYKVIPDLQNYVGKNQLKYL